VTILGTRQLRDLVIATTIINHFKPDPAVKFDLETFWCHSIATGIAARTIALAQNIPNSERLFITGLLHDIGKMIMSLLLPRETASLNKVNSNPNLRIENPEEQIFGFTHAQLGYELLASWHFPETIAQPIYHHHDLACRDEFAIDTAIVHIANVIANNIQAPISRDDDTILKDEALETLRIDQATLESYYENVYQLLDDVLQMLYYDLAA
jgi:putative nucleotidyltransferase with HDIG domain